MKEKKITWCLPCKKFEGDNISANNWANLQTAMALQLELVSVIRS